MRQDEFWHIYSEYLDLAIGMTIKINEYKLKHPEADVSEQLKIVERVGYLGAMIHKLYHMNLQANMAHGDFIAERKRVMDEAGKVNYRLKKRVEELEKENAKLKESIKVI